MKKRTRFFSSWNVQGLSKNGGQILHELNPFIVEVVVITETKKNGQDLGNSGIDQFYSGVPKENRAKRAIFQII